MPLCFRVTRWDEERECRRASVEADRGEKDATVELTGPTGATAVGTRATYLESINNHPAALSSRYPEFFTMGLNEAGAEVIEEKVEALARAQEGVISTMLDAGVVRTTEFGDGSVTRVGTMIGGDTYKRAGACQLLAAKWWTSQRAEAQAWLISQEKELQERR